jgi:hypothetical protein
MGRAERGSRGDGQSASGPEPRIDRKDLQDPGRDVPEPDRPAPDGEREQSERDPDGRRVQLEISRQDNESPASE